MLLLLIAGALLVTSCGSPDDGQAGPDRTGESTPNPAQSPADGSTQGTTSPLAPGMPSPTVSLPLPPSAGAGGNQAAVPPALLDQVRADAAKLAGVAPSDVQVVSSTAQTWNDGSLGCPKPGENFIQVMIDGFQIFVQAGGRSYDYRTSQSGFRLCEK